MADVERTYLCIDLKTFYASVECVERGLDPMTTKLVVADPQRGRSTICLAVSPAMKAAGVRNRCRVFDIPEDLDYIMAPPRMRHYMEMSAKIYGIYLSYVSPEDIHVYSIDECFIDATGYLPFYRMDARGFAEELRQAVYARTGITATVGIGPNLFLAKVALDITAKHAEDGIGQLDEERFRQEIWRHRPITDIWGIGPGIARRLERHNVYDLMGVAALDEGILYDELGVNAEYLIDHAFGREPVTIAEIRAYRPEETSTTSGQVLSEGYSYEDAYTVLREMVDGAVLDLVAKGAACGSVSLFVGYDSERAAYRRLGASGSSSYRDNCGQQRGGATDSLAPRAPGAAAGGGRAPGREDPEGRRRVERTSAKAGAAFTGEHGTRPAGGYAALFDHSGATRKLPGHTNSFRKIMAAFDGLWAQNVDPRRLVKRINLGFGNLLPEELSQQDLFTDAQAEERERDLARAVVAVKGRYGKNALLKGLSLTEKATARERNNQVGGHHA